MVTKTEEPVTAKQASSPHKLIAVASGKGGVGKTWFSITLSHALARAGKKVLLFDGDLGLANVDVQLGLMAKRDLNDVIEGNLSLERVIEHQTEGGFDVIAGRSGHGSLAAIPLPRLNDLVQQLRGLLPKYDAIIIDLGAGIDKTVRFMAAAADKVFVVTTDESPAMIDAYAFLKISHAAGQGDDMKLVVNMTNSKDGEQAYNTIAKSCEKFLKFTPPLLGIIRQDKRVRDTIRAQELYLTRNPSGDTSDDVERIAHRVAAEILV